MPDETPDDALQFDFKRKGRSGKGAMRAVLAGQAIHTASLDLTAPESRDRFVDAVCAKRPGIDRDVAAQALEELAAGCVDDMDDGERRSQADVLIELAAEAELFHDGEAAYASFGVASNAGDAAAAGTTHRETHPIHTKGFREWLARRFWDARHKAPGSQAMQDALGVLSAKARFGGVRRPVAVRLASHDGDIYLDLCDEQWRAVRITKDGWDVGADPPVRFVRRRGMQPLPAPVCGGRIAELRPLINASDEEIWRLIVAWLIGALRPTGPYPVLVFNGEQGSGKTTTCRMVRRLIDPNEADLRSAPREVRDLMIAATNSLVVGFDNLSSLPPELSDALCRLSTGGGFGTRELYTDAEEKLFNATRPILFNGIEELATRPDLLERAAVLNLPTIRAGIRRSERALWAEYELVRPRVLGALLDAVVVALRNLPDVRLTERPRMADFAEWVVAAEPTLPWPAGDFLSSYRANADRANELALEGSAIGPSVLGLMSAQDTWSGTAKELLAELETDRHSDMMTRRQRAWPGSPVALSNALRRLAPALRKVGIETTFGRDTSHARTRMIYLEQTGAKSSDPSDPSDPSDDRADDVLARLAPDDVGRPADNVPAVDRPAPSHAGAAASRVPDDVDESDDVPHLHSSHASSNGDGRERGRL